MQNKLIIKFTLSFFFVLFFCSVLKAEVGSTVVYKAKFVLKNGSSFVGYLPITGYDVYLNSTRRNEHCSDKSFQMMLIKHFSHNEFEQSFKVYKNIYLVHCGQKYDAFYLGCVDKTRINTLRVRDIKYTVFLDAEYARYDWYVYDIQEVDSSVIEVIRNQHPVNYEELQMDTTEGEGMGTKACFINFNPKISSSELYHLIAELSRILQMNTEGTKTVSPSQLAMLKAKIIFVFYGYVGPC